MWSGESAICLAVDCHVVSPSLLAMTVVYWGLREVFAGLVAGAGYLVVVGYACGLHEGVGDCGADECHASFF